MTTAPARLSSSSTDGSCLSFYTKIENTVLTKEKNSLNKTGVISPRYNVQLRDLEKWVVKLLPSRQFGYVVLTTSAGIMDHEEARRKHVAGKIIGFFY